MLMNGFGIQVLNYVVMDNDKRFQHISLNNSLVKILVEEFPLGITLDYFERRKACLSVF